MRPHPPGECFSLRPAVRNCEAECLLEAGQLGGEKARWPAGSQSEWEKEEFTELLLRDQYSQQALESEEAFQTGACARVHNTSDKAARAIRATSWSSACQELDTYVY